MSIVDKCPLCHASCYLFDMFGSSSYTLLGLTGPSTEDFPVLNLSFSSGHFVSMQPIRWIMYNYRYLYSYTCVFIHTYIHIRSVIMRIVGGEGERIKSDTYTKECPAIKQIQPRLLLVAVISKLWPA